MTYLHVDKVFHSDKPWQACITADLTNSQEIRKIYEATTGI
jgi:hypothetical protein